jgi:hypothetical protein
VRQAKPDCLRTEWNKFTQSRVKILTILA